MVRPNKPWVILASSNRAFLDVQLGGLMRVCEGPASVRTFTMRANADNPRCPLRTALPGARIFALVVFDGRKAAKVKR